MRHQGTTQKSQGFHLNLPWMVVVQPVHNGKGEEGKYFHMIICKLYAIFFGPENGVKLDESIHKINDCLTNIG